MEVSIENTSTLGRRVTICVPDATVKSSLQARMEKLSREANIKGFRKGKVPKKVIEQKFGASVRHEVLDELMRKSLGEAVEEHKLNLAGQPMIEDMKANPDEDFKFTAEFEVYPEIELADTANVEIERKTIKVSDEDINARIEELSKELATWEKVDGAAEATSHLKVNFDIKIEGEEDKNNAREGIVIDLTDKGLMPGVQEALLGKKESDKVELDLDYPADWPQKDAAGKKAHVSIEVLEVLKANPLPTEEINKQLKIAEGMDALKDHLQKQLTEDAGARLKEELQEEVLEKLSELNKFDLPKALIEREIDGMQRDFVRQAESRGKKNVQAPAADDLRENATKRVEMGLLLNKVVESKNVKADGASVRKEVDKLASQFPEPAKVVEIYYQNEQLLAGVERKVLLDRAVDAILEGMKVKEVEVSYKEAIKPSTEQG